MYCINTVRLLIYFLVTLTPFQNATWPLIFSTPFIGSLYTHAALAFFFPPATTV